MITLVILTFIAGLGIGCLFGDWLDSKDRLNPNRKDQP